MASGGAPSSGDSVKCREARDSTVTTGFPIAALVRGPDGAVVGKSADRSASDFERSRRQLPEDSFRQEGGQEPTDEQMVAMIYAATPQAAWLGPCPFPHSARHGAAYESDRKVVVFDSFRLKPEYGIEYVWVGPV